MENLGGSGRGLTGKVQATDKCMKCLDIGSSVEDRNVRLLLC